MFDPITYFHEHIGEPIGHWLQTTGFERIAFAFACLFGFAVAATTILAIADLIFGLGIFEDGPGCTHQDPYDPCPPLDER